MVSALGGACLSKGSKMSASYTPITLKLEQLLLDPNNFRFQDEDGRGRVASARFHEEKVQESTWTYLRSDGVLDLKKSILANGFLPVERIVVKAYDNPEVPNTYVVLEGNRRLAALRWIKADHDNGISADPALLDILEELPVIVVDSDDDSIYLSIMGIRHVGGIKEWGGYQSAKLVAELKDEHGLDTAQVSSRLGLSPVEVNRRYRAYRALDQMRNDEEYQDQAGPDLYALFFEAVSSPKVKEWLQWDDSKSLFANEETRSQFYSLITPAPTAGGSSEPAEAKITKYLEVRELRGILDNDEALAELLNPESSFSKASAIVKAESSSGSWKTAVKLATAALDKVGARELSRFEADDFAALKDLIEAATTVSETSKSLNANVG